MSRPLEIVIAGLSITSSWGNGHATTYRGLVRALHQRGHRVLFLERDMPWYASNRDLPQPPFGQTELYQSFEELTESHHQAVREADVVIVGSYVPEGVRVAQWMARTARGVTAFYDIDTPVTLAKLARGDFEYLAPELIPQFDLYLSFTGGATLTEIEQRFGAPRARPLYCSVDPALYFPQAEDREYELGYMGTYSDDRQPTLERLLLQPARQLSDRKFVVAGPQYPDSIAWPENVERIEHLPPAEHAHFYNRQRLTLNVTRSDMIRAGYAPSVRLFEAAACGTPILSDWWQGLDEFFQPDQEIFIAETAEQAQQRLRSVSDQQLRQTAERARQKVLDHHTCRHRAAELEQYVREVQDAMARVG